MRKPIAFIVCFGGLIFGIGAEVFSAESEVADRGLVQKNGVTPALGRADISAREAKSFDHFNQHQCEGMAELLPAEIYDRLNPLALAVAAYCEPDEALASELFERAEQLDGGRDLIVLLHAKRVWLKDPAQAETIFRRALLLARDRATRRLIRAYLAGNAGPDDKIEVEGAWSHFAVAQLGAGYDTNPALLNIGIAQMPGSPLVGFQGDAGVERRFEFGSAGAHYALGATKYPDDSAADLYDFRLETPVSARAGPREDIRLRPFGSYVYRGGAPYYLSGGAGVLGVAFRGKYRQTLQGIVYRDKLYVRRLTAQAGTHFRFEYVWDHYPQAWVYRTLFAIEHVQAGRETTYFPGASIPYSHNDVIAQALVEYQATGIRFGLNVKTLVREDDNDSTYQIAGSPASKRRQDFQLSFQPSVSVALDRKIDLVATYRWSHVFSNIGPTDYEDKNFESHFFLLSARFSWSEL